MVAHLSHKIRWDFMVDYLSPYVDPGITFPVGRCGRIHLEKRKHEIQVEMRNYITDDMICTAQDCEVTGERVFRKNNKKGKLFALGTRDERKLEMFLESFCNALHEFANTELKSPAKPVKSEDGDTAAINVDNDLTPCDSCNEFIEYLEFGDKEKIFKYSNSQLTDLIECKHGGQAVGNSLLYLLYHLSRFYVLSNVVMYLGLKEDQWPDCIKRFRQAFTYACDGQTFLPHSRQYLPRAMIDVDVTRKLSKRLFRAMYLYVMVRLKLDSSYKVKDDMQFYLFPSVGL